MHTENIIQLPGCATAKPAMDLAAYHRRGLRRYRRASLCAIASTVVDCLVSIAIGVCVCVCTLLLFTML